LLVVKHHLLLVQNPGDKQHRILSSDNHWSQWIEFCSPLQ